MLKGIQNTVLIVQAGQNKKTKQNLHLKKTMISSDKREKHRAMVLSEKPSEDSGVKKEKDTYQTLLTQICNCAIIVWLSK